MKPAQLLILLAVNVLHSVKVVSTGHINCGPEGNKGYEFSGVNWDYNSDFPDIDHFKNPTGDQTPQFDREVTSYVSCFYYTEWPKGAKVAHILYTDDAPGEDHSMKIGVKGMWVKHRICGDKAYISIFRVTNDTHIVEDLRSRCQRYTDKKSGIKYFGAEAYIAHPLKFDFDECPDVLYGGYVEVKENENTQRSMIYKERSATGRIRLFDLEAHMCLEKSTGKPVDIKKALYSGGVNWDYAIEHHAEFQPIEHYKYGGDGGNSDMFPIEMSFQKQLLGGAAKAYCVYFTKEEISAINGILGMYTAHAKPVSESNKYLAQGKLAGEWKTKTVCGSLAYFWYFVPRDMPDFTCGNYMACNHQSDLDHVYVTAMQPGLTMVYGVETGSDTTFYGSFVEIFNDELQFGVVGRRSMFYGDVQGGGILSFEMLESQICA